MFPVADLPAITLCEYFLTRVFYDARVRASPPDKLVSPRISGIIEFGIRGPRCYPKQDQTSMANGLLRQVLIGRRGLFVRFSVFESRLVQLRLGPSSFRGALQGDRSRFRVPASFGNRQRRSAGKGAQFLQLRACRDSVSASVARSSLESRCRDLGIAGLRVQ